MGSLNWSEILNAALVASIGVLIVALFKNIAALNKLEERVANLGTRVTQLESHLEKEISYLRARIDQLFKS